MSDYVERNVSDLMDLAGKVRGAITNSKKAITFRQIADLLNRPYDDVERVVLEIIRKEWGDRLIFGKTDDGALTMRYKSKHITKRP